MQRWQYKVVFPNIVEGFWSGLYAWVDREGREYGRREKTFGVIFSPGKAAALVADQLESALEALDEAGWEFVGAMPTGTHQLAVLRRPFERKDEEVLASARSESVTDIKASAR
jgi:hypothetical protein